MRDIRIVFEVTNGDINIDVKVDKPEDFVAGIYYLIEQACKTIDMDVNKMTDMIAEIASNRQN
ncbi:MAG TPA: hypothetical protein VN258_06515 [Mobilitalea sp.]|nr:hypothetical protein [Mobilitalea sp.]